MYSDGTWKRQAAIKIGQTVNRPMCVECSYPNQGSHRYSYGWRENRMQNCVWLLCFIIWKHSDGAKRIRTIFSRLFSHSYAIRNAITYSCRTHAISSRIISTLIFLDEKRKQLTTRFEAFRTIRKWAPRFPLACETKFVFYCFIIMRLERRM